MAGKRSTIPKPNSKAAASPVPQEKVGPPVNWAFSFRYWKQTEFFGLGSVASSWFAALLDRLQVLSNEPIEDLVYDSAKRDNLRYHEINWAQKNIPIQRADCTWIAREYLENADEYPFYQVAISTGLGRIIGFWDEHSIFNIVLLDPMHNMQPSARFDHRVRATSVRETPFAELLQQVQELQTHRCELPSCRYFKVASELGRQPTATTDLLMLRVTPSSIDLAEELVRKGEANCLAAIFEEGILSLDSKQN